LGTRLMKAAAPIIISVGGAIEALISKLDAATRGKGFRSFVQGFAKLAGPTIETFGLIFENVFRGLFGVLKQFAPMGFAFLNWLHQASIGFRNFGERSGSVQPFIDYLKQNMPLVRDTLASLAKAFGRIIAAFAPIGVVVLKGLK